jgi:hypothetical protein
MEEKTKRIEFILPVFNLINVFTFIISLKILLFIIGIYYIILQEFGNQTLLYSFYEYIGSIFYVLKFLVKLLILELIFLTGYKIYLGVKEYIKNKKKKVKQ